MRTSAVLSEGGVGCPGPVVLTLTDDGQCELVFHDGPAFPCTLSVLMDVALGVKQQLVSDDGTCMLSRGPGRIIATVAPWGSANAMVLFPREAYTDALMGLLMAKASRELVVA